jgi:hypothetical protein
MHLVVAIILLPTVRLGREPIGTQRQVLYKVVYLYFFSSYGVFLHYGRPFSNFSEAHHEHPARSNEPLKCSPDAPQLDAGIGFTAATFLHDAKAGTENASPVPMGAVVDPVAGGCNPLPSRNGGCVADQGDEFAMAAGFDANG